MGGADRERVLADVVQLLSHDPCALDRVTARLLAARDEAVAGLMFETAQQVHDELGAVTWLVSPQRVTALHPAGLVVRGWSAGTLVSFSGTASRLDRWESRHVDGPRGLELAQLTPPEWREFAITNAELAAELAHASRLGSPGDGLSHRRPARGWEDDASEGAGGQRVSTQAHAGRLADDAVRW